MKVVFLYIPFTERESDMRHSDASAVSFGKSSCWTQLSPLSNGPQNFYGRGPEGRPLGRRYGSQPSRLPPETLPRRSVLSREWLPADHHTAYSLTSDAPERVLLNEVFPGLRFQNSHSSALLILTPCFISVPQSIEHPPTLPCHPPHTYHTIHTSHNTYIPHTHTHTDGDPCVSFPTRI